MINEIEILVPPELIPNKDFLYSETALKLSIDPGEVKAVIPLRRSIDAAAAHQFSKY